MAIWRLLVADKYGNISDVKISGFSSSQYLTGSADPLVIMEDSDRDLFKPVKLQTGYIRFIDEDGSLWKNIVPSTAIYRPVTIEESGVIVWQGYIRPEVYSATLYDYPQVIELPIMCELSAIGRNRPSVSYADKTYNLAYLLYTTFTSGVVPTSATTPWFDYVYIQGGEIITTAWLKFRIQWSLFFEEDTSETSGFSSKYDWLEILENICTFFGWQCRTHGRSIYLCALDDTLMNSKFVKLTPSNLATLALGGSITPTIVNTTTFSLSATILRADSTEEILQGVNTCEVVADIGKVEGAELPWDAILEYIKGETINKTLLFGDNTSGIWKFQRTPTYFTNQAFGRYIITTDQGGTYVDGDNVTRTYTAYFDEYQFYEGSLSLLKNYSLDKAIYVEGVYPQDEALVSIETIDAYNFQNGILVISATTQWQGTSGDDLVIQPANGTLYMRLHVGDNVWNGTSWETDTGVDVPWFAVGTGSWPTTQTGTGSILTTRSLDDPYPAYEGYGIPVGANIGGKIKLEIQGYVPDDNTYKPIWISDLQIDFLRSTSVANYNTRDSNRYTSTSGNFLDNLTVNTIFASDNGNAAGRGILMFSDGRYLTTVPYGTGSTLEHPEQHLADRMAENYGSKVHSVLVLNVADTWLTLAPYYMLSYDSKTYASVSVSRDYSEGLLTIIYIEI